MRSSYLVKKLQTAINQLSPVKITISTCQWYSPEKNRTVNQYTVKQVIIDEHGKKNIELFKTYSQLQIILFLRDYWYKLNDREIPTDNITWEEVKNRLGEKEIYTGPDNAIEGQDSN